MAKTKVNKQDAPDKLKPIRCLLDVIGGQRSEDDPTGFVDRIPPKRFGNDKARLLRKLVLIAIAANANSDGSQSFPSLATIARRSLVSERAVRTAIKWLADNGLLRVEKYAGRGHTNKYTLSLDNPEIELPGTSETNPAMNLPGPSTEGSINLPQVSDKSATFIETTRKFWGVNPEVLFPTTVLIPSNRDEIREENHSCEDLAAINRSAIHETRAAI